MEKSESECIDCGCKTGKLKGQSGAARCEDCWEARCGGTDDN
jgi:hypothetical protein